MNPVKVSVALAFIAAVSAGSISYIKRSDGLGGSYGAELSGGYFGGAEGFESGNFGGAEGIGSFGSAGGIEGGNFGGAGGFEGGYGGEYKDFYAYPKYKFEYGVKDPKTHDHKSQWEVRDGDFVKGEYTLDEADGTVRKVSYHADGKTGFHAKVERIGHAQQGGAFGGF